MAFFYISKFKIRRRITPGIPSSSETIILRGLSGRAIPMYGPRKCTKRREIIPVKPPLKALLKGRLHFL